MDHDFNENDECQDFYGYEKKPEDVRQVDEKNGKDMMSNVIVLLEALIDILDILNNNFDEKNDK